MITVITDIQAAKDKAWAYFTGPEHIIKWNSASPDWHTPTATNDLRTGGSFAYRMEAKDGSAGFDLTGVYDDVVPGEKLAYTMSDGRKVTTTFAESDGVTTVVTSFDPENENPLEMQQAGWQAIADNFKAYVEAN